MQVLADAIVARLQLALSGEEVCFGSNTDVFTVGF
jgi:hypothetical protein